MGKETCEAFLFGQLLEEDLMHSSALSGAQTYKELSIAARTKEQWQLELRKRRQYIPLCLIPQEPQTATAEEVTWKAIAIWETRRQTILL